MTHADLVALFLALGVLLGVARILGETARALHQPAVLGELLAGILLGPTLLGALAPGLWAAIFPDTPGFQTALQGLSAISIALFLLVAGIEVDLSTIVRQGRLALAVSAGGIGVPFALGLAFVALGSLWWPAEALGKAEAGSPLIFALFMATALSISALPVIAKTLMDLNLFRSDLGLTVIAAAVVDDLAGWIIFAVLLGLMGLGPAAGAGLPIAATIACTLGFVLFMLTAGRWALHRALPWVQTHASWPGGVIGLAVVLALLGAAFTEWIGIHAIFGAFIVGVALGDSSHLKERTRQTIDSFVTFIFAPLFFASVGLKVDFATHFDLPLVLAVFVLACAGKLLGCGLVARWIGMPAREAWAVGTAMNARGGMQIILALLALEVGLIDERLFVALVVMALATSAMVGPVVQRLLRREKIRRFADHLDSHGFVGELRAADRHEALAELCRAAGLAQPALDAAIAEVRGHERRWPSGLGQGIALSQVRLEGLGRPCVALGLSRPGVDFDSPDGEPGHVIALILTDADDLGLGIELYRDAATTLLDPAFRRRALAVGGYTEFLALLVEFRVRRGPEPPGPAPATPRTEMLIVGAAPTARALARLLAPAGPVCLVDLNFRHVQEARAEGLKAVVGNALDLAVLEQARARAAGTALLLTANPEVNALAARRLRELFQVPRVCIVSAGAPEPEPPAGPATLFGGPVSLEDWDHAFGQAAVQIERRSAADPRPPGTDELVLAVERPSHPAVDVRPYTRDLALQPQDMLVVARMQSVAGRS